MAKIGISVDDELLARADAYADKNYMTRSGLFCLALSNFLSQLDVIDCMKDVSFSMRKLAENGELKLTPETEQDAQVLAQFAQLMERTRNKK